MLFSSVSSTDDSAGVDSRSTSVVALSSVVCVESTDAPGVAPALALTAAATGSTALLSPSNVRLIAYL